MEEQIYYGAMGYILYDENNGQWTEGHATLTVGSYVDPNETVERNRNKFSPHIVRYTREQFEALNLQKTVCENWADA
jgi:hypothetical protein